MIYLYINICLDGRNTLLHWATTTEPFAHHTIKSWFSSICFPLGPTNGFTPRFLGFSVYISNTTDKSEGTLCFKDEDYNVSTIPSVLNITCSMHGQYVIYYNERQTGISFINDNYRYAFNELCEFEVYGRYFRKLSNYFYWEGWWFSCIIEF